MTTLPTILSPPANERDDYPLALAWTDAAGAVVTLTALTWTLSNRETGAVIAGPTAVSAGALAGGEVVVLLPSAAMAVADAEGADLVYRRLTLAATYDSDLGTGLRRNDELYIPIRPLVKVGP